MDIELLYIAGYMQAMNDMKDKILKSTRFGDMDKIVLLDDCEHLIKKCEQTTHIKEVSQGQV